MAAPVNQITAAIQTIVNLQTFEVLITKWIKTINYKIFLE